MSGLPMQTSLCKRPAPPMGTSGTRYGTWQQDLFPSHYFTSMDETSLWTLVLAQKSSAKCVTL